VAKTRTAAKCEACAGYTYVGLLFLVAMLGVGLVVASEVWLTVQRRDKEQELLFVGNQFRRALALYQANGGGYPRRLEDLLRDPRTPGMRRYLRKIHRDPITGSSEWGLVKVGEGIAGVHSLSGKEPLKKAGFSLADQDFEGKKKYSEWVFSPRQGAPGAPGAPRTSGAARPPAGATPSGTSR
jgi:type II secretory pathway pseudopilin PulG